MLRLVLHNVNYLLRLRPCAELLNAGVDLIERERRLEHFRLEFRLLQ